MTSCGRMRLPPSSACCIPPRLTQIEKRTKPPPAVNTHVISAAHSMAPPFRSRSIAELTKIGVARLGGLTSVDVLDREALVGRDDQDALSLRDRAYDLACEAEHGPLVRVAVADDELPTAVGEPREDSAERLT